MTDVSIADLILSPDLVLSIEDHRLLTKLASDGISEASTVGDDLLYELRRASVVPHDQLPLDIVRMGSIARFRTWDGELREVELVFPGTADISDARISVMTPIGAALIGLRTGQSITWFSRDGRKQVLTLLHATQPRSPPPPDTPSVVAEWMHVGCNPRRFGRA